MLLFSNCFQKINRTICFCLSYGFCIFAEKMEITISTLRQNIYQLLDKVLETGIPLEVKRKGAILRIMPPVETDKLSNLKERDVMNCDPEELVHIDWSSEWKF